MMSPKINLTINPGTSDECQVMANLPASVHQEALKNPNSIYAAVVAICSSLHIQVPFFAEYDTLSGGGDDCNYCVGLAVPRSSFSGEPLVSADLLMLAHYKSYPTWLCPKCGTLFDDPYADHAATKHCPYCNVPMSLQDPPKLNKWERIGVAAHEIRHMQQRKSGTELVWRNESESVDDPNEVDADAYAMMWLIGLGLSHDAAVKAVMLSEDKLRTPACAFRTQRLDELMQDHKQQRHKHLFRWIASKFLSKRR